MSTLYMNIVLFAMMVATAIAIVRMNKLFAVVMLSGVFSLLAAMLFIVLDAVDVAFTEAAVGAGISTVLMLGTIALVRDNENKTVRAGILPLIVVGITGLGMVYGTLNLPAFGAADAPAQVYLKPDYMARTVSEIDIPNVVTAILASYRGYDTMGEVVVVFTAGIAVLLLLSALQQRPAPTKTTIKTTIKEFNKNSNKKPNPSQLAKPSYPTCCHKNAGRSYYSLRVLRPVSRGFFPGWRLPSGDYYCRCFYFIRSRFRTKRGLSNLAPLGGA